MLRSLHLGDQWPIYQPTPDGDKDELSLHHSGTVRATYPLGFSGIWFQQTLVSAMGRQALCSAKGTIGT